MKHLHRKKSEPKKGQFVAVWIYGDRIWSVTFKRKKGKLSAYSTKKNKFIRCSGYEGILTDPKTMFWKAK